MPRQRKKWLVAGATVGIFIVGYFYKHLVIGLALCFWRSEVAMLYMMDKARLSQKEALFAAIVCSTISISFQFWTAKPAEKLIVRLVRKYFSKLREAFEIPHFHGKKTAIVMPHPESRLRKITKRFPYFILPLYCFDPFWGVPLGIIFVKCRRLETRIALPIMLATNIIEKLFWNYIIGSAYASIKHIVIPIVCLAMGVTITATILRFLYSHEPENLNLPTA